MATKHQTKDGKTYYTTDASSLRFSTAEVADRHGKIVTDNRARFEAAVAADTPEQRAANMRAFFGLKTEG